MAAIHESGGSWRVVIAAGAPATLIEARSFAAGPSRELDEFFRRHRVGRVVRLVPGPRTIARCVNIPQASATEAAAALSLIAEAELPDSIPAHRRAAGLIGAEGRSGSMVGLLTGWPPAQDEPAAARASQVAPESWVAPAAALAALRGRSSVAVVADKGAGSIAILAEGPTRCVARVLVEDNSTPEAWAAGRERAIAETLRSVGIGEDSGLIFGGSMILTGESLAALSEGTRGRSSDRAWMEEFGLAFGAAMLAASAHPAERSLTEMTERPPHRRRDPAHRMGAWLSIRRNAWRTVVAAGAALLLLPLGLAWARAAILDGKVQTLREQEGSREELARTAALYQTLEKTRWPMTKLMADVSGALPVGVRVESVRLAPDQGLGIEATAESAESVSVFQQNLNKTGIFRGVRISRADTAPGGSVSFEIAASIASPFLNAPPANDFAAEPLAVRLYGEGASNTHWAAGSEGASASRTSRTERSPRPEPTETDDGPSAPSRPSGGGSDEVPPALTDDQIKAMDRGTAMKAWAARKKALGVQQALDQEAKDRLASEVDKLKAQMDATKQ